MIKNVRQIEPGDKVQIEDGRWVMVTANTNGMMHAHRMLSLADVTPDWVNVPCGSEIEVQP